MTPTPFHLHTKAEKAPRPLPTGKPIELILQLVFQQQREEVLRYLDNQKAWTGTEPIPILQETEYKNLPGETYHKVIIPLLPILPPLEGWVATLVELLRPVIAAYMGEAAERLWKRLFPVPADTAPRAPRTDIAAQPPAVPPPDPGSLGIRFDVVNPRLGEAVDTLTLNFCRATNETTSLALEEAVESLRSDLREGLFQGDSLPELRKRVNAVFDNAETWRAQRIAATEASRSVHVAERISAEESGVVKKLKWLAAGDACPICWALNGKEVAFGEPFLTVASARPEYAQVFSPPAHPNCQCALQHVIDADALAPGVRLDNPDQLFAWAVAA